MDARTVAALDVITAFAVPSPGCSSQGSRFSFRFGGSMSYLFERVTRPTLDRSTLLGSILSAAGNFYFSPQESGML